MQNAPRGAFCNIFGLIKLLFVVKTIVLSIFEWSFYKGFTVFIQYVSSKSSDDIGYLCSSIRASQIYRILGMIVIDSSGLKEGNQSHKIAVHVCLKKEFMYMYVSACELAHIS